jgi:DNA-binding SARP family transcriptional activator/DNA-binding beta-propeller fold protein YncE
VDFRILGPLEITTDDGPLSLPGGHGQRALLLYLLLHANEVVPTERLIDALWPTEPPATAQKMVQVYVSQLRKSLGDRLVTRPPGYVLDVREGELDATRAETLARDARRLAAADALPMLEDALSSWRGEPLLDVRYDDFAQPEITRLEELRLALIELRLDTELALGRDGELVPELERLVAEHPLRERFRAQLMTALYRSGRQGDALAAFQEARRVLLDELGLEPGDELRRLQRAVLEHDPELAAPPRPLAERVLRRPKLLALAGALLVAGAAAAAAFELTGGHATPIALRANSVAAIDPATREIVAVIPVGERPSALVYGFGSLWVANGDDGTVMRVDPRTGRVLATIGIGGDLADLAIGYGSIWVADGNEGTLTRIDPTQNAVQRTISFGAVDPLVPKPVFSVAVGTGGVWITRDTEIIRIDPRTNTVSERIATPAVLGLAVGAGRVWVTAANERILRFDDGVTRPTASIETSGGDIAPLLAYGSLWVLATGYELSAIDPGSARVYLSAPSGNQPVAAIAYGGFIWVANAGDHNIVRFSATSVRQVDRPIKLGYTPTALAAGDRRIWVALDTP